MQASMNASRIAIGALLAIALIAALMFLFGPDKRTGLERVGDAIHELPKGVGAASNQLEDRSPAQQLGDSIEDAGENMKRNVDR